MSLINQMLRDLEKRHANKDSGADDLGQTGAGINNGPAQICNRVTSRKRRVGFAVTAIALLGCGIGAGWYLAQHSTSQQATHHASVSAAPAERIPVPPAPPTQDKTESTRVSETPPILQTPSAKKSADAAEKDKTQQEAFTSTLAETGPAVAQNGSTQKAAATEDEVKPAATTHSKEADLSRVTESHTSLPEADPRRMQPKKTPEVAVSQASKPLEQRRRVLNQAQERYAAADYSATIAILRQHLEQSSSTQRESGVATSEITTLDARIHRQLALAHLRLGQTAAALNTLEQGHLRAPEDVELHLLYARVLLEQNASERAYTLLRNIPQPQIATHPDFYALRAALARHQEAYTEAVELYSLLCQLHPERGDWRLGLAISQHQQGDLDQAYQNYQRAASNPRLDAQLRDYASQQAQQLFSVSDRS